MNFPIGSRIFLLLLWSVLSLSAPAWAQSDSCAAAESQINALLNAQLRAGKASVIFAVKDHVLIHRSFGNQISSDTRFLVGSITKTLTAMIAARLEDRKQIDLDRLIEQDLPADFVKDLPDDWQKIRLKNLIHHTSGIHDYLNDDDLAQYLESPQGWDGVMAKVKKTLDFVPNSKLSYSNTNYLIAAHVLEDLTGQSYHSMLEREVVDPLKLQNTGVLSAPDPKVQGSTSVNLTNMVGNGSDYSSVDDLFTFLRALDDRTYLSQEEVTKVFSPDPGCGPDITCTRYGMGFSLRGALRGMPWVLHEGHLAKVSAVIAKVPSVQINFAMVSDRTNLLGETLARTVFKTLLNSGCSWVQDSSAH